MVTGLWAGRGSGRRLDGVKDLQKPLLGVLEGLFSLSKVCNPITTCRYIVWERGGSGRGS